MAITYNLVNSTKREVIDFSHIPAATKRELAGNPVAAAIIAWYLLEHPGDQISFVSESDGDWPFSTGSANEISNYTSRTHQVVEQLIQAGILQDNGREVFDASEPDVYMRKLQNIWMD